MELMKALQEISIVLKGTEVLKKNFIKEGN
jgi:hypothetical protein